MRIDPQSFTLDANDRHVIVAALQAFIAQQNRLANRYVVKPVSDRSKGITERALMAAARAEDLAALLSANPHS